MEKLDPELLTSNYVNESIYRGVPALRIVYFGDEGQGILGIRYRVGKDKAPRFRWRKGDSAHLYGLWRLDKARRAGYVVIVEGESNCHTLWQHDIPAVGVPGAEMWRKVKGDDHLADIPLIYFVKDPDQGGDTLEADIADGPLRPRIRVIKRLHGFKDVSEMHIDNPAIFPRRWQDARDSARPMEERDPSPDSFFDGKTFLVEKMGSFIQERHHIYPGHDGRLYRYDHGVYRPNGDWWTRTEANRLLKHRSKGHYRDEVEKWLKDTPRRIPDPESLGDRFINCKNGLLEWRTGELHPHSPEVYSIIQIPVEYDPYAECPAITEFFDDVLPDDCLTFVYQLIGTCLIPIQWLHIAVLLYGKGRNGKSRFIALVKNFLGSENCSAITLQALTEDKFMPAQLYGKLGNLCGDLDRRAVTKSDMFKQITGGDPIEAQRKYGHPFKFASFAVNIFSANDLPPSGDQSDAWFDRWQIVPFNRRFVRDEGDKPEIPAPA